MELPAHWLPRPAISWSARQRQAVDAIYRDCVAPGKSAWLPDRLPVSGWEMLCWLADRQGLLLHGSGDASIGEFEPRPPHDRSADAFSKQRAVFAASDGIWPIFYAVLDRAKYRLNMLNAALQFELAAGTFTAMHYFFSVTASVLAQRPWREGVVYILPREGFEQQPPYELGGWRVSEPHWARLTPVRPLAKLRVSCADFPLLAQVRGHDPGYVEQCVERDPNGFPWLAERQP